MNPTPEQFARLEELFAEALDLPPADRPSLLARVREQEGALMADHLQALLAAQSESTEPMFQPLVRPEVSAQSAPSALKEGDLILKRFRIVRLLGRGGMGEVYEAQDSEIGRVALKTIREDIRGESSLLRFKQEVQLARMVTSPYVCRIHEFFTLPSEGSRPAMAFLTMEYLEGETLADRIARQGPLPWHDAESIALQLCEGVAAIHGAGIIHRDFKSRNVMVTMRHGVTRAVVMDLGLAHRPELDETLPQSRTPITVVGTVMGTPDYMAPEQFEGGRVSTATDIYAFGVVLYEMVTGKLPFEASTPIAAAVRRAKRPQPASSIQPGVPHRWDTVIEKCLQYEASQRFQTASQLAAALRRPSAAKAGLNLLAANRTRRLQLSVALACLAVVAIGLLGFKWYQSSAAHKVPTAAQKLYRDATEAFHNANYLTATRQLQEALKLDPDYTLAHARLADALNELDSTGEAQREVNQIKEELVSQLASVERTYVNAVRETIRPDLNAALKDYEKLLAAADSPTDRANALVDLARTDEQAGKVSEALRQYGEAIPLDPYSPTPYLRRGTLESRQGQQKAADLDFAAAEKIYATNINLEGTAEVDYQRFYVASKLGPTHEQEANDFFKKSLDAAEKMQSVPFRVRALSRLSANEFGAAHDDEAGKVAEDAIRLAEENGVTYWATDARVRFGNSWAYRDPKKAEEILKRARDEAERNQWPRLLALSQLSLSVLFAQQKKSQPQQEVINFASPAYEYYRVFGFAQESFQCQLMLSRAKAFLGSLTESLQHATKAAELANRLANPLDQLQAQEAVGAAFLWKQDYLAALDHLTTAVQMASSMGPSYQTSEAFLKADALLRLGRLGEAKQILATVPEQARKASSQGYLNFARLQAEVLMNQGKTKEAAMIAEKALNSDSDSTGKSDLQLVVAESLTRTGEPNEALALCDEALQSPTDESPITIADAKLAKARALLELGQSQKARSLAADAVRFFESSGQWESQLLSLWLLARIDDAAGSLAEAKVSQQKIQDILSDLRHNYGAENYQLFVKRPGIAEIVSDGTPQEVRNGAAPSSGGERKAQ